MLAKIRTFLNQQSVPICRLTRLTSVCVYNRLYIIIFQLQLLPLERKQNNLSDQFFFSWLQKRAQPVRFFQVYINAIIT